MNPERWQQLKQLFEAALDKEASGRAAFLDEACCSDHQLRREVQVLLDSYTGESHDGFLEKPAYEAVPELFESEAGEVPAGMQLGPYKISKIIGHGGMGMVYLARDTRLDRNVAIKMLAPKYVRNPQFRERLKREARAAARLSHQGIATVYSLEEFGDSLYIVYEYVQGLTLQKVIQKGVLPIPELLDMAIQIARALAVAHEEGVIHRDLKPENVTRTDSGIIKILDFGLARLEPRAELHVDPRLTHSGAFLGTPAYASPEQLLGADVDRRSDIFSFGVVLYELSTGKHPFGACDSMATITRILESEAEDIRKLNPSVPGEMDRIIRRCMKKTPEDRYESTRALLDDLEHVASGGSVKTSRIHPPNVFWWWQFHQACAGFGYYGMLYAMWMVKKWIPGIKGSLLFFPAVIAVGIAANLRLHLWFTSRFYLEELPNQQRKVARWIRAADWLFVIMLALSAIYIHSTHEIIATLLMAVAIGGLVAFSLIEPTTAKAANISAPPGIPASGRRIAKSV